MTNPAEATPRPFLSFTVLSGDELTLCASPQTLYNFFERARRSMSVHRVSRRPQSQVRPRAAPPFAPMLSLDAKD